MQKVLITGGSGLLGVNWALAIREKYHVILGLHEKKVSIEGVDAVHINLENIEALKNAIDSLRPDIIVHTAGMTNVDQCEHDYELANLLNFSLCKNIATVCNESHIKLIHISTDHLYDGSKKNITEQDLTCPINVYGTTKLKGEEIVAKICPKALIARTNFFGWGGPYKQSFSDWIIDSLRAGRKIKAFDDVFYSPILIDKLANVAMSFLADNVTGVVNIVGDERISKYDFCQNIVKKFDLPENLVERSKIADAQFLTQRPQDMSLSNQYAQTLYGKTLGDIDDYVAQLKAQEESGLAKIVKEAFL